MNYDGGNSHQRTYARGLVVALCIGCWALLIIMAVFG